MEFDFNTYVKKLVQKEEIDQYSQELDHIKGKISRGLNEL